MGGSEWPSQPVQKRHHFPTLSLFPLLCPSHVGWCSAPCLSPAASCGCHRNRPRIEATGAFIE